MVMIRLARIGKKNEAKFRVIVSDKLKDTFGPYLESLGFYDPHEKPSIFKIDAERLKYWMGVGAQLSDTVHNLCVEHKLISEEKRNVLHAKEKVATPPAATPAAAPAASTAAPAPQPETPKAAA